MTDLHKLLSHGYFPRELPATFSTQDLANYVQNNASSMPPTRKEWTSPISHSICKRGIERRLLSIPNPISYYHLSKHIVDYWPDLDNHLSKSIFSLSKPIQSSGEHPYRALELSTPIGQVEESRLFTRAGSKVILQADISKCYGSIYTHSIEWALHGKAHTKTKLKSRGKKSSSNSTIGGELDKLVSGAQGGQTKGIPLGPDTSRVISEIILSSVDLILEEKLPKLKGFRHVDDYEFAFSSRGDAEKALGLLREALQEYELDLNFQKTRIFELSESINSLWVNQLSNYEFSREPNRQKRDLLRFFDLSFALFKQNPQEGVLSYAIKKLNIPDSSRRWINDENWRFVQAFLEQCIAFEPSTLVRSINTMVNHHQADVAVDKASLSNVINGLIAEYASARYVNEVAWCIWTQLFFGSEISQSAATAISKLPDSFVALLSLDASSRGLIPSQLDTSLWLSFMDASSLYSSQWLIAYEASIKGWLSPTSNADYLSSDEFFGELKGNGVEFYDLSKTPFDMPIGKQVDQSIIGGALEPIPNKEAIEIISAGLPWSPWDGYF